MTKQEIKTATKVLHKGKIFELVINGMFIQSGIGSRVKIHEGDFERTIGYAKTLNQFVDLVFNYFNK